MANPAENIRVGDKERSEALDALGEHFVRGFIDAAEFEERTGQAAAARTQGELAVLFSDLPELEAEETASGESSAQKELDLVLERGRKVKVMDGIIWTAAIAGLLVGHFVFHWDYLWVAFVIAGVASAGARMIYSFGDEDEELFEKLKEEEKKERSDRLRIAAKRRRELGR
ncbi:DUF1707 SHOCT-like domain-containing protein [Corynebacterium lowii]|uniref:DUF1707 domain-containing protein n=1 Tax=Corynebacterium lowii TaxID=1544413 RepID=A0A0N8W0C9_9CORY|nr:DUF1707 domain-containing protein [Corynebacterium lowii]KQB86346.1 hypothetical protein Clow_01266 [Corynebacterium lowii]MDP9850831.1 hypothetical protein [Corynebacterium lowii]